MKDFARKRKPEPKRNKKAKIAHTPRTKTQRHGANPKGSKEPSVTHTERRKLKRLKREGIIIAIDQVDLEYFMPDQMTEADDFRGLSYDRLIDIIARRGSKSKPPRKVLRTYLVSSKRHQVWHRTKPSSRFWHKQRVTLLRSPDDRVYKETEKNKKKEQKRKLEKAVQTTLVRVMTQELEGIEVQRLLGIQRPKRTFCVVAGDYEYVDFVQQALESGCDVELWFWEKDQDQQDRRSDASEWSRNGKGLCQSAECGRFSRKNLTPFAKKLRSSADNSAWSEGSHVPYRSRLSNRRWLSSMKKKGPSQVTDSLQRS